MIVNYRKIEPPELRRALTRDLTILLLFGWICGFLTGLM